MGLLVGLLTVEPTRLGDVEDGDASTMLNLLAAVAVALLLLSSDSWCMFEHDQLSLTIFNVVGLSS